MARYFKIVEIDEDTFIDATDEAFEWGLQMIVPTDIGVFVAVDDDEDEIDISLDCFD